MTRTTARTLKGSALFLGLLGSLVYAGEYLVASRRVKDHAPGLHFDGKRFRNAFDDVLVETLFPYTNRARRIVDHRWPKWEYRNVEPVVPRERVRGKRVVATFINHATVLIQTQGLNIITDPIWSERASPFPFLGPRRYQNPGVRFEDLPNIDLVLLSHNHYDHMDMATLRMLAERDAPRMLTHAGNAAYLARFGVQGVEDMVWGERKAITRHVTVAAVPAQHNTERWITDANRTLWGGFVIEAPAGNIYFAGDTGYGLFISAIRRMYPEGFLLGLLPIGAYAPRWYNRLVHTDPYEAYQMKQDLGIRQALAIHHGTFALGDEPQDEPTELLSAICEAQNDFSFIALKNGGTVTA